MSGFLALLPAQRLVQKRLDMADALEYVVDILYQATDAMTDGSANGCPRQTMRHHRHEHHVQRRKAKRLEIQKERRMQQ